MYKKIATCRCQTSNAEFYSNFKHSRIVNLDGQRKTDITWIEKPRQEVIRHSHLVYGGNKKHNDCTITQYAHDD